jgi:hypothetical protein
LRLLTRWQVNRIRRERPRVRPPRNRVLSPRVGADALTGEFEG